MADIFTGGVSRTSASGVGIPNRDVDKTDDDKKIKAPSTGKLVADTSNIDAFIKAQEAAKEAGKKSELMEPGAPDNVDNFLKGVDDGSIDLSNLDYQVSAKDLDMQGKFDRLKYLRTLRKDNRITNSRYISLTAPLKLSLEEAALLESREIGRDVDPTEIEGDPLLMNKYGFIEIDADLAESIEELQKAGVDVTAGAPPGVRIQVGRQSGEAAKLQALENLKNDGQILFYKPTKLGMVLTIPEFDQQGTQIGTKDVLFDEIGLDGKDFLDTISELPGIVASPALATTTLGVVGLTAISAASYFTGAVASDIINRYLSKDQVMAIDQIAKTRGIEAATGAVLEFLLISGVNFSKGVVNKVIGPMAGGGDETIKKYLQNITQDKLVTQYNPDGSIKYVKEGDVYVPAKGPIQMTAGLSTQSKTIQRVEAIAEKVPGGSDILKTQQEIIERQLLELEMQAKGMQPIYPERGTSGQVTYGGVVGAEGPLIPGGVKSSVEIGEEVSQYVSKQLNEAEKVIGAERTAIKTQVDNDLDSIAAILSSDGKTVTSSLKVGDDVIDTVNQNYKNYIKEYDTKVKNFKNIEGYNGDAIIDASGINKLAAEVEKTYPTSTITRQKKSGEIVSKTRPVLPKQLQSVVNDLKNLDDLTVDQALNMQKILNENLSSATIPTDTDRLLTQMIQQIDKSIAREMRTMGIEVVKSYNDFAQYTMNGKIYNNPTIKKILNGEADPVRLISPAYMSGDINTIRMFETALGADSPLLKDAKSAAFNEMIRKAKSSLGDGDFINAKTLWSQISALSDDGQKQLFGKNYKKVKNLIDVIAAESGTIDISRLAAMEGPLVAKLNKVIALEKAAKKDFQNKIIKPFLRDDIGETAINTGEFVRHFLKTAQSPDINKVMGKFSTKMQEDIRKRVIQEILESGRTADPDLILKEVATGQTPPHRELYNAILEFGGKDFKEANAKLTAILGQETFDLLNDIAGVQVARRVVAKEAAAAGGLVSGSIISNILNLRLGSATSIVKYRITAKVLANPIGKAWLSSQKKLPASGLKTANLAFAGPEIKKLIEEEFKNEPDNLKMALFALEDNNKQYEKLLKEDREYNEKVLRNRVPIEESNQRVIQPTPAPETGAVDTAAQPVAPAVNPASRLAGAFNPTGMMPTPTTGAINPNTMARGSALFGGPREITFAAQGGIMNARKQIQRVA
jgi:hypothetical protein